jgi:hypothetical protein
MTEVDHRGLTPLFWTHVAPYGEVRLNMTAASPWAPGSAPESPRP